MDKKLVLIVGTTVVAGSAFADSFTIFNTGVDDFGVPLAGGAPDAHWIVDGHDSAVLSGGNTWWQWPYPSDANWISAYDLWQVPYGWYAFTQTFDLTGYKQETAVLSGTWAADQWGSLYLNGTSISDLGDGNWLGLNAFYADQSFVSGLNTLTAYVLMPDGGDGLLVSGIVGTADPVPEPATLLALGVCLAALRRRR